ncbi:MAG: response regulator transcription factor [Actinobacteria bacterium]|nr:response regulator transcription factor [Actinomycetota bacterium]
MEGKARGGTVLIVEADAAERERLGSALEREGFDVLQCSGPSPPDYGCVGGREGRCALMGSADVVVLDLWLESDAMLAGTPSGELLRLYLGAGKPVLMLGSFEGFNHGLEAEAVERLGRAPEPEDLIRAVRTLAKAVPQQEGRSPRRA